MPVGLHYQSHEGYSFYIFPARWQDLLTQHSTHTHVPVTSHHPYLHPAPTWGPGSFSPSLSLSLCLCSPGSGESLSCVFTMRGKWEASLQCPALSLCSNSVSPELGCSGWGWGKQRSTVEAMHSPKKQQHFVSHLLSFSLSPHPPPHTLSVIIGKKNMDIPQGLCQNAIGVSLHL